MKCKKCGFDGIEENGDWITCPSCGAKYFNTSISPELSATKQIYEIENKKSAENIQQGRIMKIPQKLSLKKVTEKARNQKKQRKRKANLLKP